ncbi:MAG: phage tail tape measure C-terminal domain-containing protein [Alphaproteobacteria bacterium]
MTAAKKLSIRLEAVGGDKVRQEFNLLGNDGVKAFRRITEVITPANDNLKALDTTAKAFNNVLKQAAGLAGAYLGLRGLKSIFGTILSTNREFEQLSGSLKTVTGSTIEAQKAFAMIEQFALDTPYQLDEIVEAFIRLKAMGLDPSVQALTSYGNTASAFGKTILEFTGAVSSATVGEFERLKTFGIKAKTEGEKVKFIFQGMTTEVGKNAPEIEAYLRSIGEVKFAGAMTEQMDTMGGVLSNIEDSLAKVSRTIGESGLNKAVKEILKGFDELLAKTLTTSKTIGSVLTAAVQIAGKAFLSLAEHADVFLTLLATRLGSSAIMGGITLLSGSLTYLNMAIVSMSLSAKSAVAGILMMSQISKVAAIQMGLTAVAAGVLKGALALIGGPAGLAILTGVAIYKLVESHDVAKRAAGDHAETLKKLQIELEATSKSADHMFGMNSKNEALAEWGYKLKIATRNVEDLNEEIKKTGGLSFGVRHTPNALLKDYEVFAKDNAEVLRKSRIDFTEYQQKVWDLAAEYPDFKPQADAIQEKLLLLKAAKQDMYQAQEELKYIETPELRPQASEVGGTVSLPKVDTTEYKKNIEEIKKHIFELQTPYEQATQKAEEWKNNALKHLDETKAGYENFKSQISLIYDEMLKKANETALQSSKGWDDGIKRGMQSTYSEMSDTAKMAEGFVKSSFKSMEDTLVTFVMTGKASFADLVNSILQEMVRMAVQYAVIRPLMGGMMGAMGIPMPTAHSGGVIGSDHLSVKTVNPDVFTGAQKYHTGGLVGNEIPIIAQRGEAVFTQGQMQALGTELNSKNQVMVKVNVINRAQGTKAEARSTQDANGNVSLNIMIEQIENTIGRNIGRGEGLAPLLEQRYALNPAMGSYR